MTSAVPGRSRSLLARAFPPPPLVRLTRRNRRVLLVLLTGATNLGGYTIMRQARVGSWTVHLLLARLEAAGWVKPVWSLADLAHSGYNRQRAAYQFTVKGRCEAFRALGLEAPE